MRRPDKLNQLSFLAPDLEKVHTDAAIRETVTSVKSVIERDEVLLAKNGSRFSRICRKW